MTGPAGPGGGATTGTGDLATRVVHLLRARGGTVATAESLTGGLVAAALTDVPGASAVLRGGVVSYATDVKADLLHVPRLLLARHGAVSAECAAAMAEGVRVLMRAGWGVATTGVAGPEPSEGHPAGTVHVAVAGEQGTTTRALHLYGSRAQVRLATVGAALALLEESAAAARAVGGTVATPGPAARRDTDTDEG